MQKVLSEKAAQVHSFFGGFGFFFLDTGLEASVSFPYLSLFHCHPDFVIAVPCASTICHKGASCTGIEWSQVIHRKTEKKRWYGIILRSHGHVIHTSHYLLPCTKGLKMNNIQTEEKTSNLYAAMPLGRKWKTTCSITNLNCLKSTVRAFLSNITEWKENQLSCAKIHVFPNSSNVNSRIVQRFDTKSEAATLPSSSVHLDYKNVVPPFSILIDTLQQVNTVNHSVH